MQSAKHSEYYLGANSPNGFFSYYNDLLCLENSDDLYILKGGPGCGKSSFMRRIADDISKLGLRTEFIRCTSDPASLDAVVFPELKTAFVDGTAPHVIEPQYPIAVECYVNLGEFYDTEGVKGVRDEVIRLSTLKKIPYPRAYRLLNSAACVSGEIFNIIISDKLIQKTGARARGIIEREIKKRAGDGRIKKRFLSGISAEGITTLFDTVKTQCEKVYLLADNFGLSHFLLLPVLSAVSAQGYEAVVCYCPASPDTKLEHIIIPELSLAFVTSNLWHEYTGEYFRRIRLDASINQDMLRENRPYIRSLRKISEELTSDAARLLGEARGYHEQLERLLNPFVDFEGVYKLSDSFSEALARKAGDLGLL